MTYKHGSQTEGAGVQVGLQPASKMRLTGVRLWSLEEDALLRKAVAKYGGRRHWKAVAEEVKTRNHTQCQQQRAAVKKRSKGTPRKRLRSQWVATRDSRCGLAAAVAADAEARERVEAVGVV